MWVIKLSLRRIVNELKKTFYFYLQIFAAGTFEFQILEISNYKSHQQSGYCCGSSTSNGAKNFRTTNCPSCKTLFRLCLKEYQGKTIPKDQIGYFGCAFGNCTTQILGGSSFVLREPHITMTIPFSFRWTVSNFVIRKINCLSFYVIM